MDTEVARWQFFENYRRLSPLNLPERLLLSEGTNNSASTTCQPTVREPPARRSACVASSSALQAAAAGVVSAAWTRAPLAHDRRSVSHPGVGGDAAADAGRPRPAEVSRVAVALSQPRSAGLGAGRGGRQDLVSARLQHPPSPSTNDRAAGSRTSQWPAARRRGDAALVQRHRRVHGGRGAQFCIPSARGHPRHERRPRAVPGVHQGRRIEVARDDPSALGGFARGAAARRQCVRLQPGADGPRRARLHGAQAALPGLPDGSDVSDARPESGARSTR